jgi:hypothetical protein
MIIIGYLLINVKRMGIFCVSVVERWIDKKIIEAPKTSCAFIRFSGLPTAHRGICSAAGKFYMPCPTINRAATNKG